MRSAQLRGRDDEGVALIVVLLIMVVLTTLGMTMTTLAVGNLGNAGRDRVGGKAFAVAEAGVAQAIAHLRANGVQALTTSAWGNGTGQLVTVSAGRTYRVHIQAVVPLDIAAGQRVGTYLIRSEGQAGAGPGKQIVEQTVQVKPFDFPLGIFTEQDLNASGQVPIFTESVLSRGCINDRDKLTFTGNDAAYRDALGNPLPAAAHAVGYITTSNSCNANPASDSNRIHRNSYCATSPYQYDQDGLGGTLGGASPSCTAPSGMYWDDSVPGDPASADIQTTSFTYDKLTKVYGYRSRGLSDSQYAQLKAKAQADRTYFTSSSNTVQASSFALPCYNTTTAACVTGGPKLMYPVLYFKIPSGSTVNLSNTDLTGYVYPTVDSPCTQLPSVILIVEGGNLQIAGNQRITGNVFVPDGDFDFQAGEVVGTTFSRTLQLTGNSVMRLTSCGLKNVAGGLLTVTPERFHQDDD